MRNADQTAEEYREWLIECLHRFGHDELIALICPYGETDMVKAMLDIMDRGEVVTNTVEPVKTDYLEKLLNQPIEPLPMTLMTPPTCRNCSNHPSNGGSGICHCTLGSQTMC